MPLIHALALLLASDGAAQAVAEVVEPNPKAMSRSEIRAFNAKLSRDHPYFIRCVAQEEVGSLVKKNYSCRTNQQWAQADKIGNQNARDTMEAMASKATNTN